LTRPLRGARWRGRIFGAALFLLCAGLVAPQALARPALPTAGGSAGHELTEEHRFAFGLALLDAGRPREAAEVFADILAGHPGLVRVRLELARAYFLSEQWGRARSGFLAVLAGDLPDPVRANVLRFLRSIDARRGFDWNAELALVRLGDARRYESDTILVNGLPFTLDRRDGKTVTGLRYRLGLTVGGTLPGLSGEDADTVVFGRIAASGDEGPGSRFDDLTLKGEAGLRLVWPRATLSLAPFLSRRFLAVQATEDRRGVQARFSARSRRGASYRLTAGWQGIDHLRSHARDGHAITLGLGGTWPVRPRASLGLSLALADRNASAPADDARRARLTLFGALDAGWGLTLRPQVYVEHRNVNRRGPAAADETRAGASLTLETSRLIFGNGFTPWATLSVADARSDIRAFSWWERSLAVGLERRF